MLLQSGPLLSTCADVSQIKMGELPCAACIDYTRWKQSFKTCFVYYGGFQHAPFASGSAKAGSMSTFQLASRPSLVCKLDADGNTTSLPHAAL